MVNSVRSLHAESGTPTGGSSWPAKGAAKERRFIRAGDADTGGGDREQSVGGEAGRPGENGERLSSHYFKHSSLKLWQNAYDQLGRACAAQFRAHGFSGLLSALGGRFVKVAEFGLNGLPRILGMRPELREDCSTIFCMLLQEYCGEKFSDEARLTGYPGY